MTDHEIIYMIDNLNKSYVAKLGFEHPTFGSRGHPRERFGRKSLPKLADVSLS